MAAISLSRILAFWAAQQPDSVALRHEEDSVSWLELDLHTNRLARAYQDLGVGQDDFVTVALPNGIEFFQACFAAWKIGATPAPISARLPKFERDQIVELGNPALVVGVPDGEYADFVTLAPGFGPDPDLSDDSLEQRTATYYKAMTSGGSTGRPKLIVSKNAAETDPQSDVLNFGMQGSVLIPGPLYHNGPFMWAMAGLFKGNRVTVTTRFNAEQTLSLIDSERVDTVYMVPTMMQRIWSLPPEVRQGFDVSCLRTLWHLAAPCPPWLKEAFMEWLGPDVIWELYGGTEGQGGTVITGPEWLEHKGSVGKVNPGCEMKVVNEQGESLPVGEVGEIYIRPLAGAGTTYHYIGAEPRSLEGGWESIGDMGRFDDEGYLYLSDRRTDMILSGGANIYPAEVEAAIDAYPGVRSSAVIGLPHEDLGDAVHGIVDAPDGDVSEPALIEHLAERVARYKIPRSFEFVDQPLRDDAGKVRRTALRAERV